MIGKREDFYRKYIIAVNNRDIYDFLLSEGYEELLLFEKDQLEDDDLITLKSSGYYKFLFIWYQKYENESILTRSMFHNHGIKYSFISNTDDYMDEDNNFITVDTTATYIDVLKKSLPIRENSLDSYGWVEHRNYSDRCGNCQSYMAPDAKYCPECGAKRGSGEFKPYFNHSDALYGSPSLCKNQCNNCGYIWFHEAYDDKPRYCKNCGNIGTTLDSVDTNIFELLEFHGKKLPDKDIFNYFKKKENEEI